MARRISIGKAGIDEITDEVRILDLAIAGELKTANMLLSLLCGLAVCAIVLLIIIMGILAK